MSNLTAPPFGDDDAREAVDESDVSVDNADNLADSPPGAYETPAETQMKGFVGGWVTTGDISDGGTVAVNAPVDALENPDASKELVYRFEDRPDETVQPGDTIQIDTSYLLEIYNPTADPAVQGSYQVVGLAAHKHDQ